jgi:hypothetical protein
VKSLWPLSLALLVSCTSVPAPSGSTSYSYFLSVSYVLPNGVTVNAVGNTFSFVPVVSSDTECPSNISDLPPDNAFSQQVVLYRDGKTGIFFVDGHTHPKFCFSNSHKIENGQWVELRENIADGCFIIWNGALTGENWYLTLTQNNSSNSCEH